MAKVLLREAIPSDVTFLYGKKHQYSMRAITATIDGEPAGIAGVYYDDGVVVAFSRITEELRKYPLAIYKAAKWVMNIVENTRSEVIAIADNQVEGSEKLLEHLGWEWEDTRSNRKIYQWIHPTTPDLAAQEV